MGLIDDVKRMRGTGRSEFEIVNALRQKGLSDQQISDVLAQSRIKDAVSSGYDAQDFPPLPTLDSSSSSTMETVGGEQFSAGYEGMQPSMLTTEEPRLPSLPPLPGQEAQVQQGELSATSLQSSTGNYPPYQAGNTFEMTAPSPGEGSFETGSLGAYQSYEGMSSDVMAEISEQVVSEKLSFIQDKLERAINFKTIAETKLFSMEERLQRIEKIIDRLQLSLLQKVGEFVSDVRATKRELEENRKSFKALLSKTSKQEQNKTRR